MTNTQASRAGEAWEDAEDVELVEQLKAGWSVEDIAADHSRTEQAIGGHCEKLLSPDIAPSRTRAPEVLRALLGEPGYDWRDGPRQRAARLLRGFYWEPAADTILRESWDQGRPFAELRARLGASEVEIARRLITLGLTCSIAGVVERMGCEPGRILERRLLLAEARATGAMWVLIVHGARDSHRLSKGRVKDPQWLHVSVHVDPEDAAVEFARVQAIHVEAGGSLEELTVTIAERSSGEHNTGRTEHKPATIMFPDVRQS